MYKKKYKPGEVIADINDLVKQEFVYSRHKITHKGWVRGWLLNYILNQLQSKNLRYAIKIEGEPK